MGTDLRRGSVFARAAAVGCAALLVVAALSTSPVSAAAIHHDARAGEYVIVRVVDGAESTVAALASRAGAEDVQVLESLDMVTARSTESALTALAIHPAVRRIDTDEAIVASDDDEDDEDDDEDDDDRDGKDREHGGRRKGSADSPGVSVIGATSVRATGRGVTVAVMDSGIAPHAALGSRVVARVDFIGDRKGRSDPGGHGTHLAGVIAGKSGDDDESGFRGVAPSARLVSLRVLREDGTGTVRSALAAFDWLLKNRRAYNVRVLNISFGRRQTVSYHNDPLAAAAEAAWFAGVVVVTAAGNGDNRSRTVTSPGSDPFVITVGSFDDQGTVQRSDDELSDFSSFGVTTDGYAKPDVLAPGRRVVSLRASGSHLDRNSERRVGTKYMRMSGTSVAAAMVAGVTTLILERHPSYGPAQVKLALVRGGRRVAGSTTPAVDVVTAVADVSGTANTGLVPSRLLMTLVSDQLDPLNIAWDNVAWENIAWDGIAWENIAWDGIAWESVRAHVTDLDTRGKGSRRAD